MDNSDTFNTICINSKKSNVEIAVILNVRPDTVRHWRTGRREPSDIVIMELTDAIVRGCRQ